MPWERQLTTWGNESIADKGVTYAKLQDVAALAVIGRASNTTGDPDAIEAGADGDVLRRSGTSLGFGAIPQASVTNLSTDLGAKAPLASPTFTGTPAAPTASVDTNTTQVATAAFVIAQAASATPLDPGTATVGTSTRFARGDHVHGFGAIPQASVTNLSSDLGAKAPLASPTFTGTPAAPTASPDTNTTQVATTAFVLGQASSATPSAAGTAAAGSSAKFARGDHVHPGYPPYLAGGAGYETAPAGVQDASADTTYLPVIHSATSGKAGGPWWSRSADGTHPIYAKLRRGMKAATDYCGVGLWTGGDGKIILAYKEGVGYQLAHAQTSASLPALVGSAIYVPQFAWEGALANGNTYKFYGSVDGHRWVELFSVNVTASPFSDTSANYTGFFVQGTAELLIERSDIG